MSPILNNEEINKNDHKMTNMKELAESYLKETISII